MSACRFDEKCSIKIQLRQMFSMILSDGQKMIEYIDMEMGTRTEQTIDTKDVSKTSFHMNGFKPTELFKHLHFKRY